MICAGFIGTYAKLITGQHIQGDPKNKPSSVSYECIKYLSNIGLRLLYHYSMP